MLLLDTQTQRHAVTSLCCFRDLNGNLTGGKHVIVQSSPANRLPDSPVNGEMKGQDLIASGERIVDLFKQGNIYQSGQCQIVFKLASLFLAVSFVFKFFLFNSSNSLSYSFDCAKSLIQLLSQVVTTEARASLENLNIRVDCGMGARSQEQSAATAMRHSH